jgi:hypothetical protein
MRVANREVRDHFPHRGVVLHRGCQSRIGPVHRFAAGIHDREGVRPLRIRVNVLGVEVVHQYGAMGDVRVQHRQNVFLHMLRKRVAVARLGRPTANADVTDAATVSGILQSVTRKESPSGSISALSIRRVSPTLAVSKT